MTTEKKNYKDDMCAICREDYKDTDNTETLPCGHCFHDTCIVIFNKNNKCPLCKQIIDKTLGPVQNEYGDGEHEGPLSEENPMYSEQSFSSLPKWKKERIGFIPNPKRRQELLEIQKKNDEQYEKLKKRRPTGAGTYKLDPDAEPSNLTHDEVRKLRLQKIKSDKIQKREKRKQLEEKYQKDDDKPHRERKERARKIAIENERKRNESCSKAKDAVRKHYSESFNSPKISEESSVKISEESSVKISEESSVKIPEESSVKISEETESSSVKKKKVPWDLLASLDPETLKIVIDEMARNPKGSVEITIENVFNVFK